MRYFFLNFHIRAGRYTLKNYIVLYTIKILYICLFNALHQNLHKNNILF